MTSDGVACKLVISYYVLKRKARHMGEAKLMAICLFHRFDVIWPHKDLGDFTLKCLGLVCGMDLKALT